MNNKEKIAYTIAHKKAVITTYRKIVGYVPLSGYLHDLDKVILLKIGINQKTVKKIHRRIAKHHHWKTSKEKVLIEMVIDWESSRFTKPDKPRTARQYLNDCRPEMKGRIEPILDEFGF